MDAMTAMKPLAVAITVSSVWVLGNAAAPTRSTGFVHSSVFAAATLCEIKLPEPEKKKDEPAKKEDTKSEAPPPSVTLPSRTDELLAAGKTDEAKSFLEGWLRTEIRNRQISGMAKAVANQDPRIAVREIIQMEQAAIGKYSGKMQLAPTGGITAAQEVLHKYVKVHMPLLRKEGLEVAKQALPEPPPQIAEMLQLDKDFQSIGGADESWMEEIKAVYSAWSDVRIKKLRDEALAIANKAEREPPLEQVTEILEISRSGALLGAGGNLTTAAVDVAREIMGTWARVRGQKLRQTGLPIARQPAPAPPADEIVQFHEIHRALQMLQIETDGGSITEANELASTWFRNHVDRLYNRGSGAAAAGGPTPPAEVDSIMQFTRANGCMGAKETGAVDYGIARARTLGEVHLNAYRDKLDCKPTATQKATLAKIVAHLVSYGWGPYNSDDSVCDWTGTITKTTIREYGDTSESRGGGDGLAEFLTLRDTLVYEVTVNGTSGAGKVSGTGTKVLIKKRTAGQCRPDSTEEVTHTVRSGSGTVPVKIETTAVTTLVISFPDMPSKYTDQITTFTTGSPPKICIGPKPGTTTQTMNFETGSSGNNLILAKPQITKVPGARPMILLQDSTVRKFGHITVIESYRLRRVQ